MTRSRFSSLPGLRSRGMSLIEVLVSLVILSIGVLAVVGLQLVAKRNTADAGQRSIASQLGYDILERMRANSARATLALYVAGGAAAASIGGEADSEPQPTCGPTDPCNAGQLVAHDLWAWEQAIIGASEQIGGEAVGGLVQPRACIDGPAVGGDGFYTVTIVWRGNLELIDRNDPRDPDPDNDVACGSAATDAAGNRIYGDSDEFRRLLQIQAFITARVTPT